MSKSAKSLFVFGIYLVFLGTTLIIVPNVFLSIFGIPTTTEVWIRIMGMLLVILSYYDIRSARNELTLFFRWSVHVRLPIVVVFLVFVLLHLAPPILILFGFIDFVFALWTAWALRVEGKWT